MKFCTACGHRNDDTSAFCQECGAALRPKTAPALAATPVVSGGNGGRGGSGRRGLALAGVALLVLVLLIGAVGAWFWLAPPAASERHFAAAAQRYLDSHPDFVRDRTCLRNFAYGQDTATIVESDQRSRKWFDLLVEAGLYEAPQQRVIGGWFPQTQLLYRKTDAGRKVTESGRLCFAVGLRVKSVTRFTPPKQQGDLLMSRADLVLEFKQQAAWSSKPDARELAGDRLDPELRQSWLMARQDKQWEVADADLMGGLRDRMAAATQMQQEAQKTQETDWWSRIKQVFSPGLSGNMLIGKWETDVLGVAMLQYEFTADSMRIGDVVTKVRYDVKKDQVVVYPENNPIGLIVKVIDRNNIEINVGLASVRFKRAE
ncbi:MAG: zinc ribbon domain-containing protein [Proteobacteria bacterium]|nr:zinc ribbon domain-containing protein [Pseudomonadota bacterium]